MTLLTIHHRLMAVERALGMRPTDPVEALKRENAELKAMMQELLAKVGTTPTTTAYATIDQIKLVAMGGRDNWRYRSKVFDITVVLSAAKYSREAVLDIVNARINNQLEG